MKTGLLAAFALLASSMSASATTVYLQLNLTSAVAQPGNINQLPNLGQDLVLNNDTGKGVNLGSGQPFTNVQLTYTFAKAFTDPNQTPASDITAAFSAGKYLVNDLLQVDFTAMYRDIPGGDPVKEGFRIDLHKTDFSSPALMTGFGEALGFFKNEKDSLLEVSLTGSAIDPALKNYVVGLGSNPALGVNVDSTLNNYRLRSVSKSMIIAADASQVPEPSSMALLGSSLVGLGFIARRRISK